MNILAIIPARGGSKGIPLKNIKKLGEKYLIEYSILAAKNSKQIDKIVVSTDSNRIANISKRAGAEVPFLRPKKFSKDNSTIIDVIKHALKFLSVNQSYTPEIIVILQPTSPLRTTETINKSIRMLKKSNATCILSVSKVKTHPYASFWYNKKYLKPFKSDFEIYDRRQKNPSLYHSTGSIYAFWHDTIKKYDSIYGPKIMPLIEEDEFNVDVDNEFDFFVCEMKLLHWKNFKKTFCK